jgi:enoyl-CoA hydratase/carnithine racemase/methionyl-tRNA formyltransferase
MKILFLCTAHNSLSQRLFLVLSLSHNVTIEYALSDELMISAVQLFEPDLIICPFLTTRVPRKIYNEYLTLIIHPGPPGDAGPSALDWVLIGDNGSIKDSDTLLKHLDEGLCQDGRSYWGVTILQAIEEFDAGPVWAFEQFPIDIDEPGLTKSALYRGPVLQAAVRAAVTAVKRVQETTLLPYNSPVTSPGTANSEICPVVPSQRPISPHLRANPNYRLYSVEAQLPFQGGTTHNRPLLKPAHRDFDVTRHTAQQISRRIRCGDSQPGSLSKLFGPSLYLYGGILDDRPDRPGRGAPAGTITAIRDEAVCIATCDNKGIWITHIRRLKAKKDLALWPKVPAVSGLQNLKILDVSQVQQLQWKLQDDWSLSRHQTFQEISVSFAEYGPSTRTAYLTFDFYNGAMSTSQCSSLISALEYILSTHKSDSPLRAVVLLGGAYFSNGIALNVIEATADPASESWLNINRINDVVHFLLSTLSSHGILTMAAIRGNAAAGGVALAAACDVVIAGEEVVLNPAYRAVGLHGSEYHSICYAGRCGSGTAYKLLHDMIPMSPHEACSIGLIDYIIPGTGKVLEERIKNHVSEFVQSIAKVENVLVPWKANVDLSLSALALARTAELNEMAKDFYSSRSVRYHSRRFDFVRKVKPTQTPLRFATHRRIEDGLDEEEKDAFDSVEYFDNLAKEKLLLQAVEEFRASLNPIEREARRKEKKPQLLRMKTNAKDIEINGIVMIPVRPATPIVEDEKKTEIMFSCYYNLGNAGFFL